MGISGSSGDSVFDKGMRKDAELLQDRIVNGVPAWNKPYLQEEGHDIHGVIFVAGSGPDTVDPQLAAVRGIFARTVEEIVTEVGKTREGDMRGHEQ